MYTLRCTNAITEYEYAGGWGLCPWPDCRPSAAVIQERACQVAELARDHIESTNRQLHRRLSYGNCRVNLISRSQHMVGCQCPCCTCGTPGYRGIQRPRLPIVRFVDGGRPTYSTPTSPRGAPGLGCAGGRAEGPPCRAGAVAPQPACTERQVLRLGLV